MHLHGSKRYRVTLFLVVGFVVSVLLILLATRIRNDPAELLRQGVRAHESGQFAAAIAFFNRALSIDPDHAAALQARGDAHYGVDDLDAALQDYDRLTALYPEDARAHHRRAKALLGLGREDEMFAELDRALELDPSLGDARLQRAWTRFNRGGFSEALLDLDRLIEDEGTRGNAALMKILPLRAEARLSIGDDGGALADLQALREIGGDIRDIEQTIVWARWGMGEYDEALAILDRLLVDDPESTSLRFARALTLMHIGRHDESLAILDELRHQRTAPPPEADLFLWVAQMRAGDAASAAADLPPDAHFTRWHAVIARHLRGDITEKDLLTLADAERDGYRRARMQCEAFYYSGMKRLFDGDEGGAIDLLQRCVATGIRRYYEYHAAVAELARLVDSSSNQ